jgi:hypothetical protein
MITAAAMATGVPTATSSPPRASRERKMGLELGDDGRIDLHEEEEEGDEDGDSRRIEKWLEEQCRFGSMLGLGLDRESEVGCTTGKMSRAQPEKEEWEERVSGSELDKEGWE